MNARLLLLILLLTATVPSSAQADTIINFQPGTTTSIDGLSGFWTLGDMMTGMHFTVTDGNQNVTTATWQAGASPDCGGVTGTGWSISLCGDTYYTEWVFDSSVGVSSVLIDSLAGNSVFDLTFDTLGTDGSSAGLTFALKGRAALDITATYIDLVALSGEAPVGDLFRYLRIDFAEPLQTNNLKFRMDTDSIAAAGVSEQSIPVPEPSTLALLAAGLYATIRSRRRTRK